MAKPPPKKARTRHWPVVSAGCRLPQPKTQLWTPPKSNIPQSIHATIFLSHQGVRKLTQHTPFHQGQILYSHQLTPLGAMPLKATGNGVTVYFAKQDVEGNFKFLDQTSDPGSSVDIEQETNYSTNGNLTYCALKGYWFLTRYISWEFKPKKVQIDWDSTVPETMQQRCRVFGTDLATCVHNFVTHMHQNAEQTMSLGLNDAATLGAPVAIVDNNPTLLCDNTLHTPHWAWYRSCIGDKKLFSFPVRDAYLMHSNKQVLDTIILPLVISHPQSKSMKRQLIVIDTMPDLSSEPNTLCIHSLSQLQAGSPHRITFYPVIKRRDLKAEFIRVYILATVISDLMKDLCSKLSVQSGQALEDMNHGMVTHKCIRHGLRLCSILSDLPWDRVVTCCACPVKLPPGHKIGFWWTLCHTMSEATNEDAPLSRVTVNKCKFVACTVKKLNRYRMIDLSSTDTTSTAVTSVS